VLSLAFPKSQAKDMHPVWYKPTCFDVSMVISYISVDKIVLKTVSYKLYILDPLIMPSAIFKVPHIIGTFNC
jgi:hypothetical protein